MITCPVCRSTLDVWGCGPKTKPTDAARGIKLCDHLPIETKGTK